MWQCWHRRRRLLRLWLLPRWIWSTWLPGLPQMTQVPWSRRITWARILAQSLGICFQRRWFPCRPVQGMAYSCGMCDGPRPCTSARGLGGGPSPLQSRGVLSRVEPARMGGLGACAGSRTRPASLPCAPSGWWDARTPVAGVRKPRHRVVSGLFLGALDARSVTAIVGVAASCCKAVLACRVQRVDLGEVDAAPVARVGVYVAVVDPFS